MSNNKLRSAKFSINELIKGLKGYSYASLADMRHMLNRCIKDLHENGYKLAHIKGLKSKHVHVLVEHWKKQGKNPATIKNYMSKVRKTAVVIDKPNLVKADNAAYNIPKRSYAPTMNKAIENIDLSKCTDSFIRLSLEAQVLFGLRREESMKIILSEAWQGERLTIKPSWTKGGIGRSLLITNQAQREWLQRTSQQIPQGHSLIPRERSYKKHLSHYQMQAKQMGLSKLHGLRHAYAQRRYHELTKQFDPAKKGWLCPVAGGQPTNLLTANEKAIDHKVRAIISRTLGHSRICIVKIYCG